MPSFIVKNDVKKFTLGVVYEPDVPDSQGDYAEADEIERAAWKFMKRLTSGTGRLGDQHQVWDSSMGSVVELYTAPADFTLNGTTIRKGTWLMGVVWSDDYWQRIQSGERTGFSMGGTARRVPA